EPRHRQLQLFFAEQKPLRPPGNMNRPAAIKDAIALRTQRAPQAGFEVQMRAAVLSETHDPQAIGSPDGALLRLDSAFKDFEQRGFAAAVRSGKTDPHSRGKNEIEIAE